MPVYSEEIMCMMKTLETVSRVTFNQSASFDLVGIE